MFVEGRCLRCVEDPLLPPTESLHQSDEFVGGSFYVCTTCRRISLHDAKAVGRVQRNLGFLTLPYFKSAENVVLIINVGILIRLSQA